MLPGVRYALKEKKIGWLETVSGRSYQQKCSSVIHLVVVALELVPVTRCRQPSLIPSADLSSAAGQGYTTISKPTDTYRSPGAQVIC